MIAAQQYAGALAAQQIGASSVEDPDRGQHNKSKVAVASTPVGGGVGVWFPLGDKGAGLKSSHQARPIEFATAVQTLTRHRRRGSWKPALHMIDRGRYHNDGDRHRPQN